MASEGISLRKVGRPVAIEHRSTIPDKSRLAAELEWVSDFKQKRNMFPYRRNGKKRTKTGPQQLNDSQHGGQGQRVPGSARELLRLLQPTTKALAQLLVGNSHPSGQLRHARNVLDQAQYLVEEREVERLPPREREEFLEQFARLKLTVTDARDLERAQDERGVSEPRPERPAVAPERLREMALALSSPPAERTQRRVAPNSFDQPAEPEPEPVEAAIAVEPEPVDDPAEIAERSGPRGQRLRLKRTHGVVAATG